MLLAIVMLVDFEARSAQPQPATAPLSEKNNNIPSRVMVPTGWCNGAVVWVGLELFGL